MRRRLPPALHERDFALLWGANVATALAMQMILVAVGWQVYAIHHDPFDLGLIGLVEFVPLLVLALPAGQLADVVARKVIILVSLAVDTAVAALLLTVTLTDAHRLWPYLALAALTGAASALSAPALRALLPELVPPHLMASAMALRAVGWQSAVVVGPAVGGALFAARPELPYAVAAVLTLAAVICSLALHPRPAAVGRGEEPPGFASLVGGIRFLVRTRMVLGAILLDLFAVLFGGAIALAPVFASSILHVGPVGLGALRSAPAVGAVAAGVWLTRRPLGRAAGPTLLVVVALFGVAMIVFGLSRWLPLSLAALAVSGFVDMFSMNIRSTTIALVTPNEVRGRVSAVEMLFIGASNELGAFESGVVASLIGTTACVVAGGVATIGIALSWTRLFPSLARLGRLEDLEPAPAH